jgi:hypothetical protein
VYFSTIIGKLEQQHDAERVLCKLIRAIPLKELFDFWKVMKAFYCIGLCCCDLWTILRCIQAYVSMAIMFVSTCPHDA